MFSVVVIFLFLSLLKNFSFIILVVCLFMVLKVVRVL